MKNKDPFYRYETIQLRHYLQIASSGNVLLVAKKQDQDVGKCYEVWEEIVSKNSKALGNSHFNMYMATMQTYGILLSDYNTIKAALLVLHFQVDNELIQYLLDKGYPINTTNSRAYEESLYAASRKSDNITTKIMMRHKELESIFDKETSNRTDSSELVATLSFMLGFAVEDNILLAKYNQYQLILRKKNQKRNPNE